MRRRMHARQMRRRIHACHMRRRIHTCHMKRRIHLVFLCLHLSYEEEDTCMCSLGKVGVSVYGLRGGRYMHVIGGGGYMPASLVRARR
jgi:hypothetical protein